MEKHEMPPEKEENFEAGSLGNVERQGKENNA